MRGDFWDEEQKACFLGIVPFMYRVEMCAFACVVSE